MQPHTRAMIAASTYVAISGDRLAGLYDHTAGEQLRIAAEAQGHAVQGADEARSARFGGTLPEVYDFGDRAYVSIDIDGTTARGYDRASGGHYTAQVEQRLIQIYDHDQAAWFAFEALEFG